MKSARPFVLLALAVLLAPQADASRTAVGGLSTNTSEAPTWAARTALSPLVADPVPGPRADAALELAPRLDLGDVELESAYGEREGAFHLGTLELLAQEPPRGPPASYPETRVGGFELPGPFRVGGSPSLSLWSRRPCGSISCDLASDSPQDPWGLLGLEDVPGILADYVGSNVKSAAGTAVGLADQASGGRITGALRAYQAAQATDGSPTQWLAAAYGAYEQGKLAVTTLGFSEAPDKAAHAAELVGLRGISGGASALGEGIETGDVDAILRGGAEAAGGIGQLSGTVAAVAAPFEKALATHTIKFDASVISSGPLPLGGAKVVRAPPARAYSAAYETSIPKRGVGTREAHFKAANENLTADMARNPQLAAHMDALGVGVPKSTSGTVLGESPANWTWHHVKDRPGVLQLVPRPQHRGGPWQGLLHPQQEGGFKIWGSQY